MNNSNKCIICNKKFKSNAGLGRHIKVSHKMSTQQYYDKYIHETSSICKICNKSNRFINLIQGYTMGCCTEHTNIIKYGTPNVYQSKEIINKIKEIKKERYGDENYNNREKAVKTLKEQYGVENVSQLKEVKEKVYKTNLNNLGVEMPFMSENIQQKVKNTKKQRYNNEYYNNHEKYKQTCIDRYDCESTFQIDEVINKIYGTKKEKGNISKYELILEKIFNDNNIQYIPQYKDYRYPYHCDFYLPNKDIFIELNIYPTHGEHPYNSKNKEDIKKLNELKKLANKNRDFYERWISIWTIEDVNKYNTALKNKLNYYALYNIKQIEKFLKDILKLDYNLKEIYKTL